MKWQRSSVGPCFNDSSSNLQHLSSLFQWLLKGISFRKVGFRSDCNWTPRALAISALIWAMAGEAILKSRFQIAVNIASRTCRIPVLRKLSYQAFTKCLAKHSAKLIEPIVSQLRHKMQNDLGDEFELNGRAVFAVDGTKVLLPKTKSNEKAYAKTRKRKQTRTDVGAKTESGHLRNKVPQFYVTMIWNLGTRLLWDWKAGPSNASETEHLEQMIGDLPKRSLIVADAGFIGYDLWQAVFDSGHDWLVRVGANVKLLKKLGFSREYGSTVYYWPNAKREKGLPPMIFRLIQVNGGKHPIYLLTNLATKEFSNRQVADLYARRWGIEVFYRTFKCTFGRSKLRSHNAMNAKLELEWSLVSMWAIGLMALSETDIEPARLSMAGVISAVRQTITNYRVSRLPSESTLSDQLCSSQIDSYHRKNKSPRHPTILTQNYKAPKKPKVVKANKTQINKAIKLKEQIRLTA